MSWMLGLDDIFGYVYYTNKISTNLKEIPKSKRITYIKHPFVENKKKENKKEEIKPYDYQLKAQQILITHFKNNNRGILSMPCGTGKTLVSYLFASKYEQIIIISPLKQFAKQNLVKFIEYGIDKNNTLLVDSDGSRDIDEIKQFIKLHKSFCISSTFCSVDIIQQCLKIMSNPIIIIDEFHNLSKTNINNENDDFYKILYSNYKILFVSATPRIYEIEDEECDYDINNIFGKKVYNMTFTEAIKNKYITDYKIWLPSIHEKTTKLDKELSIYKINKILLSKCKFLFSCILNNGSQKCIIYCQNRVEINNMIKVMNTLDKYFSISFETNKITSEDSEKKRTEILKQFSDSNMKQLLFSVRILDECIDVPKCDSIYITYSSSSKIRTIQRLCRCIRTDKNNKFKIGNIYIWCDEYDTILETLSGIKEYDIDFKTKIEINTINFHGDSDTKIIKDDEILVNKYIVEIKEYRISSWNDKLNQLKKYIDEHCKKPSEHDKNDTVKKLAKWISHQKSNYEKKIHIMKNKPIYDIWTEFTNDKKYKQYFLDNTTQWKKTLNELKKYIDENNKRPANHNKNNIIQKLSKWISHNKTNYEKKIYIMKNKTIYDIWTKFTNDKKYKQYFYFIDNTIQWKQTLNKLKKYIDENDKRPSDCDKNDTIKKLARWLYTQKTNYKNKIHIMKNKTIYNLWSEFINNDKYKQYFKK
jgi:superfamily II DNA or RNA helicase